MRVAIIIPRIAQLGPVKVIQALVNKLCDYDDVNIKLYYLDKEVDTDMRMNVPVARYNSRSFSFDDYDIIHTNGIRPDLIAFMNRKKIKYHISTIHNFVFDDLEFSYNRLISWVFGNLWLILWKRADKLVCVSEAVKNYCSKWFSETHLEVIYNGIAEQDNSFRPDSDVLGAIDFLRPRDLKILGFAGILTKRKGIDQLLHLLEVEAGYSLIIIGQGKEFQSLKRLAEELKITERLFFAGFRSEAVNYIKYFDFFIMPSRSEGFGLAMIEAAQQKVPVICSDIEVFRELMNVDEVTFFKLEDITSLTNALKVATETSNKKVDKAYTRYFNNYTDSLMAKRYYELYKSA